MKIEPTTKITVNKQVKPEDLRLALRKSTSITFADAISSQIDNLENPDKISNILLAAIALIETKGGRHIFFKTKEQLFITSNKNSQDLFNVANRDTLTSAEKAIIHLNDLAKNTINKSIKSLTIEDLIIENKFTLARYLPQILDTTEKLLQACDDLNNPGFPQKETKNSSDTTQTPDKSENNEENKQNEPSESENKESETAEPISGKDAESTQPESDRSDPNS